MKPDMTDVEQGELEQKLRKAVIGHRPPAPEGLLDFIGTVPAKRAARRWALFGMPAPRAVRAFGAVAIVAVLIVAVSSSAFLMSARPATTPAPGATQSEAPSTYGVASMDASASPTEAASPSETASIGPSTGPTATRVAPSEAPNGSPTDAPTPVMNRTISGRVTNLAGNGLAGIYVCPWKVAGGGCTTSLTDSGGHYSVRAEASQYTLEFGDESGTYPRDGFLGASGFTYDQSAAMHIDVTAADATGIDIVLPAAIIATLHVTDTSGTPLAGISCWMNAGISYWKTSDSSGNCSFAVQPAPGKLTSISFFTEDPAHVYVDGYYSSSLPNGFGATSGDTSYLPVPGASITYTIALPAIAP